MPGRSHQQAQDEPSLCRRCRDTEHSIIIRTEPLCVSCFCKYVRMKVVKRMEALRVRPNDRAREQKLLLALSLGTCSTALLHLLSEHLQRQAEKSGRTWYKLCILLITDDYLGDDSRWHGIKSRYPDHEYISVPRSDCASIDSVLHPPPEPTEITVRDETSADTTDDGRTRPLFDSLSSPTARSDTAQILMRRLVVQQALGHGCEAILWGDSTTRLAQRTLAETAKGRGFSLPWVVADGETPQGIAFHFPLRDLLRSEISAYVSYLEPPLTEFIVDEAPRPAVSTKHTTIDELMQQYFHSVEREYPSVVANVVKTTEKLRPVPLDEVEQQCELCEMPLEGQGPSRSRLCYGCIRTIPSAS